MWSQSANDTRGLVADKGLKSLLLEAFAIQESSEKLKHNLRLNIQDLI